MKIIIIKVIVLSILISSCEKAEPFQWKDDHAISVMSFNIRYDTEEDGENKWDNRKEACVDMLNATKPSVFGIQEGLHNQVAYLDEKLHDYDFVGVGRDDGHSSGEYAAIYYSTNQFELLSSGHFWLSESPDYPSLGWDANNIRMTSWVELLDLKNDQTLFVFNTHFDHKGKKAREESSKLLVDKINEIANEDVPVFITGDFNAWISNPILEPITETFFDARRFAINADNLNSFNLWGKWYAGWTVDYIFFKNAHSLAFRTVVEDYGVPYISDHYPILSHFNYND